MSYVYPLTGSPPVTETHAQGDPGVDWGVPTGTPIYAIAAGIVTKIGEQGYGPNYIEIDHGNGIQSFYGHGSLAYVHVGQRITQGMVIGLTGNMGNSTGPHLELGVRVNGQLVDPIDFLQKQGGQMPDASADPLSASQAASGGGSSPWTAPQIAASFGLSASLFNSNPELANVLQEAVAQGLTPDTPQGQAAFTALLQSTNWYKSKTDAQRKWALLSTADPAEARQQFVSSLGNIIHTASSMGVHLSTQDEWILASNAASLNLTPDEVKFSIAGKLKINNTGLYGGDAGKLADDLRTNAHNYGMPQSAADIGRAVYTILNGHSSEEDYLNNFKQYASSMFPGAKAAIAGGKTLADVAQPYLQTYQNVLEQNPQSVDLTKDPTIRKALSYQAPETAVNGAQKAGSAAQTSAAEPTTQPLWQFEQSLKNDPRWLKTDNAQQSVVDAGAGVLRDLGLSTA